MLLENILDTIATFSRTRRRMKYYYQENTDPDSVEYPVLMGNCFENACELSYDLYQNQIPHRVIYGGIAYDSIALTPSSEHFKEITETTDIEHYIDSDTGRVDPAIWDENEKPKTKQDIPDETNHYWIEVNGSDTMFPTTKTYHVEIAAEAREHYDEVLVYEGHPKEFYIKPDDCYTEPWERNDNWTWNPETLEWVE